MRLTMKWKFPLWPLGEHAQDVIDYLSGRGIRIVNVQSDDRIPEQTFQKFI